MSYLVMWNVFDPISIKYPSGSISTPIVMPVHYCFTLSWISQTSTLLESETFMIDTPDLDHAYEHSVTIRRLDWVGYLGFLPSSCIHVSYETFRPFILYIR